MRKIGAVIGYLMWIGAGIIMFIFWFMAMSKWLGVLGGILAFILTPGIVVFPIVYWFVEGVVPSLYFIVWGAGIVGIIITYLSIGKEL